MSSREENLAKRTTRHLAKVKYTAWNSSTIPLSPVPEKPGEVFQAEQELLEIWLWYDEALDIVRRRFEQTCLSSLPATSTNPVSRVIAESFYAAERSFGPESRLHNVFGPLHTKIMHMVDAGGISAQCKLTRVFWEQTKLMIYQWIQVDLTKDLNLSRILQLPSQATMLCSQTSHPMRGTEGWSVLLTDILTIHVFYCALVMLTANVSPPLVSLYVNICKLSSAFLLRDAKHIS